MAHFAKIDSDNKVLEVIVINNNVITDKNGNEQESLGLDFIASLGLNGDWLQCSYNRVFRGNYPGVGYVYDKTLDAFIPPKPYESWVLDEATYSWVSPIPHPNDGGMYTWDESDGDWVEVINAAE